jgi:hypothetical protein
MPDIFPYIYSLEVSAAQATGVVVGTNSAGANVTGGNIGFGLRDVIPLNSSADPITDPDLNKEYEKDRAIANQPNSTASLASLYGASFAAWSAKHPSSSMAIGGAFDLSNVTKTTTNSSYRWNGAEGWITGSIATTYFDFIPFGQYRGYQFVETKGVGAHQNAGNTGVQIKWKPDESKFDTYAQFSEQWKWKAGGDNGSSPVWSLGLEFNIASLLGAGSPWIQLGWSNQTLTSGSSFFGTSIRWGTSSKQAN